MLRAVAVAGLIVAASLVNAAAEDISPPHLSHLQPDWAGAVAAFTRAGTVAVGPATSTTDGPPSPALSGTSGNPTATVDRLNQAAERLFAGIGRSPVPVLLPVDIDALLQDREAPKPDGTADRDYLSGFRIAFFQAGPAGYDAVFTLRPRDVSEFEGTAYQRDVEVHITGAAFVYDIDPPTGAQSRPIRGLPEGVREVRRIYLQHQMRYLFSRYGVAYSVSVLCFDGRSRARRLSCHDAHPIVMRALTALRLAGGSPQEAANNAQPAAIERPAETSQVFTYYGSGQLIPRTGYRSFGGKTDSTAYAPIRFPLASAPAHVYSQLYMTSADCSRDATSAIVARRRGQPIKCVAASDEEAGGSLRRLPWRDNFCESRDFSVGECPGGKGHQGQDIVPADCLFISPHRCPPDRLGLVAVQDSVVLRAPGKEGLTLLVNTPTEHIRFRYLHMEPDELDRRGLVHGRILREGDDVGLLSNYNRREDGTSHHLHFDMQVLTRDGWILINPYMTLVAAYERLIGKRGEEIPDRAPDLVRGATVPPFDLRDTPTLSTTQPPPAREPLSDVRGVPAIVAPEPPLPRSRPLSSRKRYRANR